MIYLTAYCTYRSWRCVDRHRSGKKNKCRGDDAWCWGELLTYYTVRSRANDMRCPAVPQCMLGVCCGKSLPGILLRSRCSYIYMCLEGNVLCLRANDWNQINKSRPRELIGGSEQNAINTWWLAGAMKESTLVCMHACTTSSAAAMSPLIVP